MIQTLLNSLYQNWVSLVVFESEFFRETNAKCHVSLLTGIAPPPRLKHLHANVVTSRFIYLYDQGFCPWNVSCGVVSNESADSSDRSTFYLEFWQYQNEKK